MRIPVQAEGGVGFKISTAMSTARRRGLESPSTACSRARKVEEMVKVIRRLRKFPYACSLSHVSVWWRERQAFQDSGTSATLDIAL